MKKIPRFILLFVILLVFCAVLGSIYLIKVTHVDQMWLPYHLLSTVATYLPLISALSILWSLVFKDKNEVAKPKSGLMLSFLFYTIFTAAAGVGLNEFALPAVYDHNQQTLRLEKLGVDKLPVLLDTSGTNFTASEMDKAKYYLYKDHIAFAMGTVMVSMGKLYNAGGTFYVDDLKIVAYTTNGNLDYVITSRYAKEADGKLVALNPIYYDYSGGSLVSKKQITGRRAIPLLYNIHAIYDISSFSEMKDVNMISVMMYNDFVYHSKLNLFRLGNIVYNKVAYYVILIFLMIIASSLGWSMQSVRAITKRDVFQVISFYIVTFFLAFGAFDLLVKCANMIYALMV